MAKVKELTKQAQALVGIKEGSTGHKALVDLYNSFKPLPRGVKMTTSMSWCAMFQSALAMMCNATDIIPIEISCGKMIEKAQKMGIWVEDESITPKEGYLILYDWQDNGKGDNKGWADHIGYVEKVSNGVITVIEGNISNAVGRREIKVNAKYIRGYITPKYEAEVSTTPTTSKPATSTTTTSKPTTATIEKGDKVRVLKAINYTGKSFRTWYDVYDVIQVKGDRAVIGIGKTVTAAINIKNIALVKKGN